MNQEENILGTEKIGKLMRKFSIPCIISNSRSNIHRMESWNFRKWSNKCSIPINNDMFSFFINVW